MEDDEREEVFLTNVALGTDLLTSYVAATDDAPSPPGKAGWLTVVVILVILGLIGAVVAF